MAEYIERHEVLDDVRNTMFTMSMCLTKDELDGMRMAQQIIAKKIETFPAADVVPVRHGRWLIKTVRGDKRTVCSECLLETGTCYEENYCPNCGARMDAEEREKRIRKTYIDVGSCRGWIIEGGLDKDGDGE